MNKIMLAGLLLSAGTLQAAPLVDIYAGAYTGRIALAGDLAGGSRQADLETELGYDNGRQTGFYVGLEHGLPFLPNARLRRADFSETATGTLNGNFDFGGETFTGSVSSGFELDSTDLTLYYTPLDVLVKLDVGLTARRLSAQFDMRSAGLAAQEKASATIPMLYAGAYAKLPLTGFYVTGELNAVSFDGDKLMDGRAGIGWVSDFLLGLELGYAQQVLDIDIDEVKADINLGGPFLAVSLNF